MCIGSSNLLVTRTHTVAYFGGLKDSPTCRHNLHEVTYSIKRKLMSILETWSKKIKISNETTSCRILQALKNM